MGNENEFTEINSYKIFKKGNFSLNQIKRSNVRLWQQVLISLPAGWRLHEDIMVLLKLPVTVNLQPLEGLIYNVMGCAEQLGDLSQVTGFWLQSGDISVALLTIKKLY